METQSELHKKSFAIVEQACHCTSTFIALFRVAVSVGKVNGKVSPFRRMAGRFSFILNKMHNEITSVIPS
jgi:hypothetical protein